MGVSKLGGTVPLAKGYSHNHRGCVETYGETKPRIVVQNCIAEDIFSLQVFN